jgi:hypothetical protein
MGNVVRFKRPDPRKPSQGFVLVPLSVLDALRRYEDSMVAEEEADDWAALGEVLDAVRNGTRYGPRSR